MDRMIVFFLLREGLPFQKFPKYRHCLDGGEAKDVLDNVKTNLSVCSVLK